MPFTISVTMHNPLDLRNWTMGVMHGHGFIDLNFGPFTLMLDW